MKKQTLPLLLALSGFLFTVSAQVGVNTTTPASTLDIAAKNATGTTTNVDGLLVPRVDRQRAQSMSAVPVSTLIYINNAATGTQLGSAINIDATGYYFFSGGAWVKLVTPAAIPVNIYNANGSLTNNRTVTQAGNTLAFTGTATNAFSVDGSTLSVDAANSRLGVGTTTPAEKLDVIGGIAFGGQSIANKTAFGGIDYFSGQSRILSWGSDAATNGVVSFWTGLGGAAVTEKMRIHSNGNVGIGTGAPQKKLHVNGDLQITNELNVGGNATTAGSAGTSGQILTSAGAGVAPTWQNAPTSVNIYNADGSLTNNRTVTQAGNTLAFTGTATNAFSVDGSTLSVDAANSRLGVGTIAPENKFHVVTTTSVANRYSLIDAPAGNANVIMALRNTSPQATGNFALLGFTNSGTTSGGANWGIGSLRTATGEDFFFGNSLGAAYLERMRIASNGFIGIGTATPQKKLHVNGDLQITNELNVGGNATTAGSAGTSGQILTSAGAGVAPTWQNAPTSVNIYNADGSLTNNRIVTQAGNTLAFTGTATNAFSVDGSTLSVDASNDRLGVGTATPAEKLDVRGGGIAFTGQTVLNKTAFGGLDYATLIAPQTRILSWGPDTATNGVISFWTGLGGAAVSEKMRVHSNGNVGIGTATPQKTLHVNGDLQITNELNVGGNATTAGSAGTSGQILTSAGAGVAPTWQNAPASVNIYNADGSLTNNRTVTQAGNTLAFTGTATNAFSVDGSTLSVDASNDRLGVGTATPAEKLDVRGGGIAFTGQTVLNKTAFGGLDYATLIAPQTRILSWGPDTATNGVISFWTGLGGAAVSEKMRVHSNGNVGIGTATPQKTLHVNGDLQITNELNVGGNATTAGSAGTSGQILTSAGVGVAPTWQNTPASVNIYNSNGTLTGNRLVTQAGNTLAFTGTVANAFSVDGSTLSVDASNNRVGIGTIAPENKFQVVTTISAANRFSLIDALTGSSQHAIMALRNTSPAATGNYALLGFTNAGPTSGGAAWGIGSIRTSAGEEDFFFGNSLGSSYLDRMRITSAGLIGIGTATPQKKLHVNGDLQITNELNVGGNATTAGSAGTSGQILTSAGSGVAPTWQNAPTSVNIYNGNGTLTGNRLVTQAGNTLAFTGTVANAFSVDGSTFSVDASNNRVGIGSVAPTSKLTIVDATNANQFQGIASVLANNLTQGVGIGWSGIQSIGTNANADLTLNAKNIGNIVLQTQSTGNVGIGITVPENKFHVVTTAAINNRFTLIDGPASNNSLPIMALRNTSPAATGNYTLLGFSNTGPSGGGANWGIGSVRTVTAEDFFLGNSNPAGSPYTERIRVTTAGLVGIATNAPTSLLSVNGTADKVGGGSWGTFSDSRMKKNVHPYTKGLPEILKINTVTFQYNGKGGYSDDGKTYTGVIAQEIEKVLPGTVTKIKSNDFDDQRKYDSSELTYALINAIKEQQKLIEEQKKLNEEQNKLIRELQADVLASKEKK